MEVMKAYINSFIKKEKKRGYNTRCKQFLSYLIQKGQADEPKSISNDDIIDFILDRIKEGEIKTEKDLVVYLEMLDQLYFHMNEKYDLINIFDEYTDLVTMKNILISELPQMKELENPYQNDDAIKRLLIYFNECDSKSNDFTAAKIFTKIMLIAPAKTDTILTIRIGDFCNHFRILRINDITISINNSFRTDLINAIEGVQSRHKNETRLFDFISDNQISSLKIGESLSEYLIEIGYQNKIKNPIEYIRNSAIFELYKCNTNLLYLAKISGSSMEDIKEKLEEFNQIDRSDYNQINESIKKADYYNYI